MGEAREWPDNDSFDGTEVFATEQGRHYHEDENCRHLDGRRIIGWDKSAAWIEGMDPCDECGDWPSHVDSQTEVPDNGT